MRRLTALTCAVITIVLALGACGNDDPTQQEFNEKLDGVAADPAGYELTIIRCVNDGEFIDYEWGITNLSEERRTYAFDPFLITAAGDEEQKLRALVGESVGPGEYMQWESFAGGGERFPVGDVECRFEVVDSVLGAFRGED